VDARCEGGGSPKVDRRSSRLQSDRAGSEWSEQWPLPRARSVDTELAIEDAVTAQAITDAFHDAELITNALDDAFAGRRSQDEALAAYELTRDGSTRPMFDLTCQLGANDPPSDEEAELFALIASREDASQNFVSVLAGTMPVDAFFDPRNLQRYGAFPRTSVESV
jgi:hypothetical protein